VSVAYYNLSKDYSGFGDLIKTMKHADSSLVISMEEGYKARIFRTFLRKSIINRDNSQYKEAYDNYRKYKSYADSVNNINDIKKIQELELKYKSEQEKRDLETKTQE